MSLGLELDFLAVIGLVKQIRKSFTGAPEQFKAISEDVRGFSIVLQDIEANCTELSPEQSQEYQSVVTSCKHLLVRLRRTLEEYSGVAKSDKPGKRTAVKRVWKRLKWEPDDIRDIRSQISVKIGTLRSLNDQVTSHNIVKLIRHQEDTEREATIEWVSEINYVAQQNDIFLRCQTGSRRWLFESEIYLEWLRRKGSLLFCPGHPGTGKTFTAAMVIESLRLANDADTLTAYMYCSYQNHTLTIEKLLCSLLRAALEEANREADGTISTCKQLRLSNKLMSRQHCLSLLQDLLSRFTRVNLIVDALDELTNEVRRPLIYDLLKLHDNSNVSLFVTSRGNPEIQHLFESSEVYTSLEVRSSDEDIRNFLSDNIFQLPKFVDRSPELRDEVIESVTNASAGMFLLAELYLKSLASVIPLGNFRIRLSTLSTGSDAYDTLYKDSMLRIRSQGPESERIAVQMLLVLTCARRPLSPQELSHALSIDESSETFDKDMVPDMDDLVAVCAGLVRLDDTSNIVHLVHKSAAEYFERKDIRSHWFPMAHMKMASMCLRYIQIAEKKPEETRGEQAPFLHYAKANWNYHFMNGEEEAEKEAAAGNPLQLSSATDSGALQNTSLISRLAIQQMFKEVVDVHSAIVEACYAGHRAWVEQLLVVRNYDINKCGISQESFISEDGYLRDNSSPNMSSRDGVLLTIAAARGDCNMAQMLLARGADPNIFNTNGQTPLIIAVMNNFDNMVSLLLDQKLIKPDLMCRHSGGLSTAFLVSIELGGERCFGRLFERSNHRTRDSFKRGAMWLAASSGHTGIISQLLESHSIEVDYDDTDFCGSPLIAAARGEHEEAALLLLPYSKGQSCSHCGISPMYYAVRNGFHNLLERLLEKDASEAVSGLYIDPRKKQGRHQGFLIDCKRDIAEYTKIPLLTAIYLQDMKATQLLLPHAHDKHLYSQLIHEVSEWDNAELFQLLLKQENVKPDSVDEDGKTPFPLAAKHGYCDIMDMLIKPGDFQIDRRVADGNATEDHRIANSNYAYCFRLLASVADRDINEKDLTGSSLLHQACRLRPKIETDRSGSEFVADFLETNTGLLVTVLLMRPGVNVNLLDGEGETPLLIAVKNHQRDVVRLLLEQEDTNVLAQDGDGNDALLLASIYEPMFEQLFPWRASSMNHDLPPLRGQVPTRYRVDHWPEVLNAEFKEYDESIFSMLIHDKRTNPYRRNFQGDSVINRVVMTGTKSMIQALAETTELASELEIIYPDGKSVLSLALQKNQDDGAVDLLIAHCSAAVLRKADAIGRTPLSYAVQRATSQATRSLLAADVDINAADSFGLTPLSYATDKRYIDAACLLIAVDKTQVNLSDRGGGLTPLMHAIFDTNIPLLSALLDRSDIDVMATDKEGHSLLCYLLESHYFRDMCERELEKELESVINRIHHRLQLRARVIHSPFICALESDNALRGIYDLQRFAILLEFFHTGLEFSRCATTAGLLEILDEDNRGACSDDRDLGLRALRLFTNRGT